MAAVSGKLLPREIADTPQGISLTMPNITVWRFLLNPCHNSPRGHVVHALCCTPLSGVPRVLGCTTMHI